MVNFGKMWFDETYSAAEKMLSTIGNRHQDNPFIRDITGVLRNQTEKLRSSIAFHELKSLAADSDAIDTDFDTAFRNFRNMVELSASIPELGEQAKACAEIAAIISRHNRNLCDKPKDIQIALMDSVINECTTPADSALIVRAQVKPLFDTVVRHHSALKEIEKNRTIATVDKSTIASPSEASKSVKPTMSKLYKHIVDYAEMDNMAYQATLADLDAALSLVSQRVKNRSSKTAVPQTLVAE